VTVAIKATKPAVVTCDDCGTEIKPTNSATCSACFDSAVEAAAEETDERPALGEPIRDWAHKRVLLGQMTPAIAELFMLCADDIEVGHG
jgi:hypothetical protein